MILLLGLLLFAWLIYILIRDEFDFIAGTVFLLLIFVVFVGGWTLVNHMGYAKWKAFYDANYNNYSIGIDKTTALLSQEKFEKQIISGSIEKFKQSEIISKQIADWIDQTNKYNNEIAKMKYLNGSIIIGVMIPDGVDELKLIRIGQ